MFSRIAVGTGSVPSGCPVGLIKVPLSWDGLAQNFQTFDFPPPNYKTSKLYSLYPTLFSSCHKPFPRGIQGAFIGPAFEIGNSRLFSRNSKILLLRGAVNFYGLY